MKPRTCLLLLFILLCGAFAAQKVNTTLTYSVNLPLGKTAKTPVLILLHGYGSNEADLFDLAKTMDPRFITFSLRAPNQTGGDGFCWYEMEFLENKQFTYNYEDVKASRAKILSFISNACKAYHLDSTRVFLLGFSQGAIMAYDLALAAPSKIKGVLALSGRLLDESKLLATNPSLPLTKVKFFIGHGSSDNTIKLEEAEKADAFLKEKHVTGLTFKSYEMPHSISGKELNDMKAWLVKAISPPEKKPAPKK